MAEGEREDAVGGGSLGEGADFSRIAAEANNQVRQVTREVRQHPGDCAVFEVDGKDKSWFVQKGAVSFEPSDPAAFRMDVTFIGGELSRFGDDYAELARAEQLATINWMLMVGVVHSDYSLTGYKDCKAAGFFFLLQLNYRRTRWRVACCPHDASVVDAQERRYPSDVHGIEPLFEVPACEGQALGIEYAHGILWLLDCGSRIACGTWAAIADAASGGVQECRLPPGDYIPAILTPNCPTRFHCAVH